MGAKERISNQSNSTLAGGDTVPWWEIPMENSGKADKNPQLTFDVCSFQMQNAQHKEMVNLRCSQVDLNKGKLKIYLQLLL